MVLQQGFATCRQNQIEGQINLRDAIRRNISFTDPKSGKAYSLKSKTATLMVRPRGWHLPEKHIRVDDKCAACLPACCRLSALCVLAFCAGSQDGC